jgi:hypothetical protein
MLTEFRGILIHISKNKHPTELYKRLYNVTQGIQESVSEFVMQVLDLRQRVLAASTSEDAVS